MVPILPRRATAAWRNGIASDYESGDCRFDPCGGHRYTFWRWSLVWYLDSLLFLVLDYPGHYAETASIPKIKSPLILRQYILVQASSIQR